MKHVQLYQRLDIALNGLYRPPFLRPILGD